MVVGKLFLDGMRYIRIFTRDNEGELEKIVTKIIKIKTDKIVCNDNQRLEQLLVCINREGDIAQMLYEDNDEDKISNEVYQL